VRDRSFAPLMARMPATISVRKSKPGKPQLKVFWLWEVVKVRLTVSEARLKKGTI